jgi:hypothetical protein
MSDSLLAGLAQQFGGDTIGQLANLIGGSQEETRKAVAAALPILLGSMAGAAQKQDGANALFGALNNDHDGSILDMLGPLLAGGYASRALGADGGRVLSHLLGKRQPAVEQTVAKSAGISTALVQKLLPILAPIVMGYLGKRLRGGGLDAGGLGAILGGDREQVKKQDPGLGGIFDLLCGGSQDDDDDDGGGLMDMAGDLLGSSAGKKVLGQVLGR